MSKKKVITVSGDSSKWYDKVIFVVKKDNIKDYKDVDFVLEAENIISNYMLNSKMDIGKVYQNNLSQSNKVKTNNKINGIDMFLYSSICICIMLVSILIVQSF